MYLSVLYSPFKVYKLDLTAKNFCLEKDGFSDDPMQRNTACYNLASFSPENCLLNSVVVY